MTLVKSLYSGDPDVINFMRVERPIMHKTFVAPMRNGVHCKGTAFNLLTGNGLILETRWRLNTGTKEG